MARPVEEIGQVLIERGWRQGSLLPAVGRAHFERVSEDLWQVRQRDPGDGERLIIVSQDCDIRARREQFVEAMPCYWVPKGTDEFTASRKGNSGRFFLVQRDGIGKDQRALIVDATDRVQVVKTSLVSIVPEFPVPAEGIDDFYKRFRPWLGGRYSRVPLDPEVVRFVQGPIAKLVDELSADEETDPIPVLREIRMAPIRGTGPFVLDLIVLIKDGASISDERVANLIGGLAETFENSADGTSLRRCAVYTAEELPVSDYERTWKLPYDYFSWEGVEEIGVPPVYGIDFG